MIVPMAALAWAQVAEQGFAPALDRPYRFVTENVRDVAGHPRHFVAEQRLLFRRDGQALVAEVTLERLVTDAPGEVGRRFLVGSGGLKGRTVRFRLAADGSVASIDDQPAVWAAMLAGIVAMTPKAPTPDSLSAMNRDPAAAMAAVSPERQRAVIASSVAGLFADPATLPPAGSRPIRIPGRTLPGEPILLEGREVVDRSPDGLLRLVTRAANAQLGVVRTRVVDPATGLLASEEETTSFTLDGRPAVTRSARRTLALVR